MFLPSIAYGVALGAANESWWGVVMGLLVWPFARCVYVSTFAPHHRATYIQAYQQKLDQGQPLVMKTAVQNFLLMEFVVAALTGTLFGVASHFIKGIVT